MKKTIKFLTILILVFNFTSCDQLEDATSVDINTVQKASITAHVNAGNDVPFNQNVTINIDNSDTHSYLNLIKKVSINSLTYRIINFTGDANGSINVDLSADNAVLASHAIVVKTTADSGVIYKITDTAALNAIAAKLKSGSSVVFAMKGTSTSNGEMDFKVEITLDLKITASPL